MAMESVFNVLLRDLAEEHTNQVAKLEALNVDLQREMDILRVENGELHEQLDGRYAQSQFSTRVLSAVQSTPFAGSTSWGSHASARSRADGIPPSGTSAPKGEVFLRRLLTFPLRRQMKLLILSSKFEFFIATLVTASAVVSALELQHSGLEAGYIIGYPGVHAPDMSAWDETHFWLKRLDLTFTAIFTVELALRILLCGCAFFRAVLNWLDIIAVAVSLLEIAVADDGMGGAGVLRLLRLFKLARGLRLVKMVRVLESLTFLLHCIWASLATLFWSLCVLTIIQCISGMLLSQLVQDYLRGNATGTSDAETSRREVYAYYGTFSRTMITMFEIHLANWAPACRVLVDNVGEYMGHIFVVYRCLAGFAVLHVINAVFVQQTLRVAQQDQDIMIMQKQKAQEAHHANILEFFKELDQSGDGTLSKDEFQVLLTNHRLKTWLACLDIDINDCATLFQMLDDGEGDIDSSEFVRILTSIRGPAKSIDMAQLLARTARMESRLNQIGKSPTLQLDLTRQLDTDYRKLTCEGEDRYKEYEETSGIARETSERSV